MGNINIQAYCHLNSASAREPQPLEMSVTLSTRPGPSITAFTFSSYQMDHDKSELPFNMKLEKV